MEARSKWNLNGRPVGSRHQFSGAFLRDLAEVWQEHGKDTMLHGPKFVLRGLVRRNSVKPCASEGIIRIPPSCAVWRYVFKRGPIVGIVSLRMRASTMINVPRI